MEPQAARLCDNFHAFNILPVTTFGTIDLGGKKKSGPLFSRFCAKESSFFCTYKCDVSGRSSLGGASRLSTGQGQENNDGDEGQDGENKDTAFRPGGSAAKDGLANGVAGEEMVLSGKSAVGDSVNEGLAPIPCAVEADGPPQRSSAPQAQAPDHASQAGGEQSDGRFSWVVAMAEAKENGEDHG